jgi:hypothetical protein
MLFHEGQFLDPNEKHRSFPRRYSENGNGTVTVSLKHIILLDGIESEKLNEYWFWPIWRNEQCLDF